MPCTIIAAKTKMQFKLLAQRQEAIPIVGRWYNRDWGQRLDNETEAESIAKLDKYLNEDRIPFIVVASDGDEILGAAQLKFREMGDLFPDKEHWLGGVFVDPQHRGCGIASRLVQEIVRRALDFGVTTLHLQTERLDGGLYYKLGWRPVTRAKNRGLDVLVMERHIDV